MTKNERVGLIAGIVLGVPASYYFQSAALKAKMSVGEYLQHLPELLSRYTGEVLPPILISCAIAAAIGWFIGRQLSATAVK